jgi:hypothetical protein
MPAAADSLLINSVDAQGQIWIRPPAEHTERYRHPVRKNSKPAAAQDGVTGCVEESDRRVPTP